MALLTDQQRSVLDEQIRQRILDQRETSAPIADFPVTAVIEARISLGLGKSLEKACPFYRECETKLANDCSYPAYRGCPIYQGKLVHEVIDRKLDLVAGGIS